MFAIQTEGLGKTYKNFWTGKEVVAVNDLTMEVPVGEIFGFLGPNGAGKTTTIKMLVGLTVPTKGKAYILGEKAGSESVKARTGYLAENPSYYKDMRALDFLIYCGELFDIKIQEAKKKAEELLELVGLREYSDEVIGNFSRGMVQRIGIAQALINDPDLLFLDEPLSGLDPVGRKEIKDTILRIKEDNKTVFFSSHIIPDVEDLCTWIGIINQGELITIGRLKDLLNLQELRFHASDVPSECINKLDTIADSILKEDTKVIITLTDIDKEEEVERIFREYNIENYSVDRIQESLERFFLDQIG